MKDYSKIIGKVTSTPWMITDDALKMMLEILEAHLEGKPIDFKASEPQDRPLLHRAGNVGVLNLSGPIFPKANLMTEMSGATSLDQFRSEFREAMNDGAIKSVLLHFDSPGGLSDHVEETAMEIREARDTKPIYAIADTAMCSAAYYLGSQASQVFATPSAQVGSIGVYTVHKDDSVQKELSGVKETVIKAGRFKASMVTPLSEDTHGHLQELVNATNDRFMRNVALGRNTTVEDVQENYGEGGIVTVEKAFNNGMIDGIRTYDQVLDSMRQAQSVPPGESVSNMVGTSTTTRIFIPNLTFATDRTNGFVWTPGSNTVTVNTSYDADKEHSEPGTGLGGEPTPREPPEKGDKAIENGWRRDPPPIAYEEEESAVTREWMEERANALGIAFSEDVSDEELATAITEGIDSIVVPLTEANADAARQRQFEQDYPEQAAQFLQLLETNRETEARNFAEGYGTFEGSNKGFSIAVRGQIAEAHSQVSLRQFTHANLKTLLDAVSDENAVVAWGEEGSNRFEEKVLPSTNFAEARKQFADLVRTAQSEDNLSQAAAIAHVSEQHPDLAEAYLYGHTVR